MKIVYDFLWWLIEVPTWTWITIGLIVLTILFLLVFWCMIILGKNHDDQSEKLYQKMVEERKDELCQTKFTFLKELPREIQ